MEQVCRIRNLLPVTLVSAIKTLCGFPLKSCAQHPKQTVPLNNIARNRIQPIYHKVLDVERKKTSQLVFFRLLLKEECLSNINKNNKECPKCLKRRKICNTALYNALSQRNQIA